MKNTLVISLAGLALAGFAVSAKAEVVFTDTFTSGTAADAGYYRFGTTATTLAADNVNSELDYQYEVGSTSRSGFIKSFSEQTLAVGESISLSFSLNSRLLGSGQNQSFRWAIGNQGTVVSGDLASATPFSSGTRQMFQFAASTSAQAGFGQYNTGSDSPIHGTVGTSTAIAGFSGPASIATTGTGSVSLTITRTETGYSFTQSAFGVESSGTLTTGTNIFNTVAFGFNVAPGAGVYRAAYDTISVAYTPIPEPSAFAALAGLTGLVLAGSRRRARR